MAANVQNDGLALLAAHNNAEALILEHGKILIREDIFADTVMLMRRIVHEEVEAIFQIRSFENRSAYSSLMNSFLDFAERKTAHGRPSAMEAFRILKGDLNKSLGKELLANDMLSNALEMDILIKSGYIKQEDLRGDESVFLDSMLPYINSNRHNHFTGIFYEDYGRERMISLALAKGIRFTEAAGTEDASGPATGGDGSVRETPEAAIERIFDGPMTKVDEIRMGGKMLPRRDMNDLLEVKDLLAGYAKERDLENYFRALRAFIRHLHINTQEGLRYNAPAFSSLVGNSFFEFISTPGRKKDRMALRKMINGIMNNFNETAINGISSLQVLLSVCIGNLARIDDAGNNVQERIRILKEDTDLMAKAIVLFQRQGLDHSDNFLNIAYQCMAVLVKNNDYKEVVKLLRVYKEAWEYMYAEHVRKAAVPAAEAEKESGVKDFTHPDWRAVEQSLADMEMSMNAREFSTTEAMLDRVKPFVMSGVNVSIYTKLRFLRLAGDAAGAEKAMREFLATENNGEPYSGFESYVYLLCRDSASGDTEDLMDETDPLAAMYRGMEGNIGSSEGPEWMLSASRSFVLMADKEYGEAIPYLIKCMEGTPYHTMYFSMFAMRMYAYVRLSMKQEMADMFRDLSASVKDVSDADLLVAEATHTIIFLPDEIKAKANEFLVEALDGFNPASGEYAFISRYLSMARSQSYYKYLMDRIARACRGEKFPGISAESMVKNLKYFYSIGLYEDLSRIDVSGIPDKAIRRAVAGFKSELDGVAKKRSGDNACRGENGF